MSTSASFAPFDAHRGYEVDTQGDSFFVAFPSARDALLAAVDGQRALLATAGPMGRDQGPHGLHTGQAIAADGRAEPTGARAPE